MKVKELNLIGFGKFNNKVIELEDGINIIYGENESGKSTLHSFIDGMFYGFIKPYVKSTIYLDEHKRYKPWAESRYAGIIRFYYEGRQYRIERDFTKNKEETKVLVENTGEDITYDIDTGDKSRVIQPGFHFFGFNNGVYSNTVSIKQLKTRTENRLAYEVRDRIVNVSSTMSDEISIDNTIKELDKQLKDIGSVKATTSIYGNTYIKINKLEESKDELLKLKIEYEELLEINEEINDYIDLLYKNLSDEKYKLKLVELMEKRKIYNEAIEINESLKNLDLKLPELSIFKNLNEDEYNEGIVCFNNIQILSNKIEELSLQINEIHQTLQKLLEFDAISKENRNTEISKDYLNFDILEEEKNKLNQENNTALEFFKRDYRSSISTKKAYMIGIGLCSIIYLVFMYLGINRVVDIGIAQIFILPVILLLLMYKKSSNTSKHLILQVQRLEQEVQIKKQKLVEIETSQKEILDKYDLNSKLHLRTLYEKVQNDIFKKEEEKNNINNYQNRLNQLYERQQSIELEKDVLNERYNKILLNNKVENLEEFKIGIVNKKIFNDTLVDIINKKEILRRILGSTTLENLRMEVEDNNLIINKQENLLPKDSIINNIESIKEDISVAKLKKKGVEEKISYINENITKLVELEEELNQNRIIINKLDKKRAAIELAKTTIEVLAKEIHNQFAPEINKNVGDIIDKISGGKYNSVRINNNLEIGVIDPSTGEIIDVNNLSSGTIDQLYFGLRFSVINSMEQKCLPLILDDCFMQYDDIRLKNILYFLKEISNERQVILFSCHNRERKFLEEMNIKFNLITLS